MRGSPMHPELRLIEDFLTDRGVLSLPALPRMLYVVRGSITIGQRVVAQGEALFGEDLITAHAEGTGATLWRWELSDPRQPAAKLTSSSIITREKLAMPLLTLPDGELLWRGDSVAFPPGGCAYLHRHQGPGIRCLIDGELRIDMQRCNRIPITSAMLGTRRAPIRCSRRPRTGRRASSA